MLNKYQCGMELRHLRYFVAIVEQGGVRAAADRLGIAQPAISRQLKDLETELGFALFQRVGRGLALTAAGRTYLQSVTGLLGNLAEAGEEARRVAEGRAGRLSVGLLENVSWSGPAPEALRRFARTYPEIQLNVQPMSSVAQFKQVADGNLDAGFGYVSDQDLPRGVSTIALRHDNVVLAASRDLVFHHDGDLSLEEIDGLPMVGFPRARAPGYFDRLALACRAIGFAPNVVQIADDETTMVSLVSAGIGCAIVNSANRDRPPENVQFRGIQGLSVPLTMVFLHREPPNEIVQNMMSLIEPV